MKIWHGREREARDLVVIADASADPRRLAEGLLDGVAQWVWPMTSIVAVGRDVAEAIFDGVAEELGASSEVVRQTWAGRAGIYVAEDTEEAARLALALNPLKVALRVADPEPLLEELARGSRSTQPVARGFQRRSEPGAGQPEHEIGVDTP